MTLSGLILDVYDDTQASVLQTIYPDLSSVPEMIKSAQVLSFADRERLPDDVFALVLEDGTDRLRKYACIDRGNTELSIKYFLKTAHKLPETVVKTAAENLLTACSWYDIEQPTELKKLAGGINLGKVMTIATLPSVMKGTADKVNANSKHVAAAADYSQRVGGTMEDQAAAAMRAAGDHHHKLGEVTGTADMPLSPPVRDSFTGAKTSIKKTAHMHPVVQYVPDAPKPPIMEKRASTLYALPSMQHYPLDSYTQVKTASNYIESHWEEMTPSMRREYCSNLVKRANDLSIPVSERVRDYGTEKLAEEDHFSYAIHMREQYVTEDMGELLSKVASAYGNVPAADLCEFVEEFDKLAGIDRFYGGNIPDPYETVYQEKVARKFSDVIGNLFVNEDDLKHLAQVGKLRVESVFGEDIWEEFRKDPVGIYKSMPATEKKMFINLAKENAPGDGNLR